VGMLQVSCSLAVTDQEVTTPSRSASIFVESRSFSHDAGCHCLFVTFVTECKARLRCNIPYIPCVSNPQRDGPLWNVSDHRSQPHPDGRLLGEAYFCLCRPALPAFHCNSHLRQLCRLPSSPELHADEQYNDPLGSRLVVHLALYSCAGIYG
jgi:hypothetical protein